MQPPERFLQRLFDRGHQMLAQASERWRIHANRRTIVILIVGGTLAAYIYISAIQPPDTFPLNTLISVDSGMSVNNIASSLRDQGVIRSPLMFRAIIILMGDQKVVHAGDYIFKEPLNVFSIARALAVGQYGLEPYRIRVPEGATAKEMVKIFSSQLQRFNATNFLTEAQPQEGYLFPDTYYFLPNAREDTVIQAMRQNFDQKIAAIQPQIASSTHSLSDLVIMASILEREAYNTQDRKMIAGVLWNRLTRGMPLQVDAAFSYTIGKGTFQLTMKDLTTDSPYNTYLNKGLPPTPIGSPSLDSLLAAATPIKSSYLYFLADQNGITHYCKNYECQLANKQKYF
jgi:UPF0755 protein